MAQFHVNTKGEPGKCRAYLGHCPYGNSEEHFDTPEAARAAYEKAQETSLASPLTRDKSSSSPNFDEVVDRVDWLENEQAAVKAELTQLELTMKDQIADVNDAQVALENADKKHEAHHRELLRIATISLDLSQRKEAELAVKLNQFEFELQAQSGMAELLDKSDTNQKAKEILKDSKEPFNSQRVAAMARFATSHNSGSTVVETKEDVDAVLIRMSSWPRAKEAEKHFASKGWSTDFTGDSNGGELIRVHDPANSTRIFKNSKDLNWSPEAGGYGIDASEFGEFPRSGFTLISQKDGSAVSMIPDKQVLGGENEVLEWTFKPENGIHRWNVTLYND